MNIALPLLIVCLYAWISRLPDLRLGAPEWVGASALIVMLLALACFYGGRMAAGWSAGFIVGLGALIRLMFLSREPELSDDIYRYVFDGCVFLSGTNPYDAAPVVRILSHPGLSDLAALVNHAHLPTIYPPAAQFVFLLGSLLGGVMGMKSVLVVLDICSCVLMARILRFYRLPATPLILYAWHPLAVMEVAGSGHIDAAVIFFVFLTAFLLTTGRSRPLLYGWGAGIIFAAAVLTKWLPLIFLPGFLMMARGPQRKGFVWGLLVNALAMTAFFWPEILNGFDTLYMYAANWEFSGFAFRVLRQWTGSGNGARWILAACFLMVASLLYYQGVRNMKDSGKHSGASRGVTVFRKFYAVTLAFLVLTPTLHPWYALHLVGFLPFAAGPAGLILSWSVCLGYRVVIGYGMTGQWAESDLMTALMVAGPAAAGILGFIFRACHGRYHGPLQGAAS